MFKMYIKCMALCGLMLLAFGCMSAGNYKRVETQRVIQMETKEGTTETVVETIKELASLNVIERSTNVRSVSKVTNFKGEKKINTLTVSPDGRKILTSIIEENDGRHYAQLWALNISGTGLTKVTSGRYYDLYPTYSPDGKYIFFSSNRGEARPKIWRIKATGVGGLTRVTSGTTSDTSPHVSATGELITYTAKMFGAPTRQIWTVGTKGNLPTQYTEGHSSAYSPDGKKMLFIQNKPDAERLDDEYFITDIWVMDEDGASRTQLTSGDATYRDAQWSPDSKNIIFSSNLGRDENKKHNFDIWMMNADGSSLTQLTTNGSVDVMPRFGPDGRYVYFKSNRGAIWEIWRMELAAN